MKSVSLFLKVTHDCNLNCSYCYDVQLFERNTKVMEIEKIKKLIDMAGKYFNDMAIFFHGGEPLTLPLDYYREIIDYTRTLKGKRFSFSMQSNGTLLTQEHIDFFKEHRINYSMSYDGTTTHKHRCPNKMVEDKLKLMADNNMSVGVVSVANEDLIGNIVDEYKNMKNFDIGTVKFNPLFGDDLPVNYTEKYVESMKRLFDYWHTDKSALNIPQFEDCIRMLTGHHGSVSCLSCHEHWMGMDYDGLMGLCDFGAYPRDVNFGYLDDYDDFGDILYGEKRLDFLKQMSSKLTKCRESECSLVGKCTGGCNAQVYRQFGTLDAINSQHCIITRELVKYVREVLVDSNLQDLNIHLQKYLIVPNNKQVSCSTDEKGRSFCG